MCKHIYLSRNDVDSGPLGDVGLDELKKLVDKACDSDRLFFERKPNRQYRVRRCHSAEVAYNAAVEKEPIHQPPGMAWFTAVICLCSGYRMRQFFLSPEHAETNLSERQARRIFEGLADDQTWKVLDGIRAIACKGEAA